MSVDPIQNQPPRGANQSDAVRDPNSVKDTERVKSGPGSKPGADAAAQTDTVEISERARELARAQQAVEAAPDVRDDKVAELKQQIADGTYNVPAETLADKLLDLSGGQ